MGLSGIFNVEKCLTCGFNPGADVLTKSMAWAWCWSYNNIIVSMTFFPYLWYGGPLPGAHLSLGILVHNSATADGCWTGG